MHVNEDGAEECVREAAHYHNAACFTTNRPLAQCTCADTAMFLLLTRAASQLAELRRPENTLITAALAALLTADTCHLKKYIYIYVLYITDSHLNNAS